MKLSTSNSGSVVSQVYTSLCCACFKDARNFLMAGHGVFAGGEIGQSGRLLKRQSTEMIKRRFKRSRNPLASGQQGCQQI